MALSPDQLRKANARIAAHAALATKTCVDFLTDSDGQIILGKITPIERQILCERMALMWRAGYLKGWEDK